MTATETRGLVRTASRAANSPPPPAATMTMSNLCSMTASLASTTLLLQGHLGHSRQILDRPENLDLADDPRQLVPPEHHEPPDAEPVHHPQRVLHPHRRVDAVDRLGHDVVHLGVPDVGVDVLPRVDDLAEDVPHREDAVHVVLVTGLDDEAR